MTGCGCDILKFGLAMMDRIPGMVEGREVAASRVWAINMVRHGRIGMMRTLTFEEDAQWSLIWLLNDVCGQYLICTLYFLT